MLVTAIVLFDRCCQVEFELWPPTWVHNCEQSTTISSTIGLLENAKVLYGTGACRNQALLPLLYLLAVRSILLILSDALVPL